MGTTEERMADRILGDLLRNPKTPLQLHNEYGSMFQQGLKLQGGWKSFLTRQVRVFWPFLLSTVTISYLIKGPLARMYSYEMVKASPYTKNMYTDEELAACGLTPKTAAE